MTVHPSKVIRWPFALTSANNDVRFADDNGAGVPIPPSTTRTIATGTYITKGEAGTGTPTDFVDAFQTEVQAAYALIHGGGATFTVALNIEGHVEVSHDGVAADNIIIFWTSGLTTLDPGILGYDPTPVVDTVISTTVTAAPHQIKYAWYPGDPGGEGERDSGDQDRTSYRENSSLTGRKSRVSHSSVDYFDRTIRWATPGVLSARIFQFRTDDAAFAAVAALTTGDPNAALVNLKAYLLNRGGPFPDPGRVYVYTTAAPATHQQQGPYEVDMPRYWGDLGGVDDGELNKGMSQEFYSVLLQLRRVA